MSEDLTGPDHLARTRFIAMAALWLTALYFTMSPLAAAYIAFGSAAAWEGWLGGFSMAGSVVYFAYVMLIFKRPGWRALLGLGFSYGIVVTFSFADCQGSVLERLLRASVPVSVLLVLSVEMFFRLVIVEFEPEPVIRYVVRGDLERRKRISPEVRQQVYERDGYACLRCRATENLSLDHIAPWAFGGSDDPDNLQTLCRSCNSSKGVRV